MGLVTGGPSGTARGVFGPVKAAGINTGGKTGTAQKIEPVYDPKTGEPKTRHRVEKDNKGNIIREYEEDDHGRRASANRRLVFVHRAARAAAARDGGDCRRRRLRIEVGGADCRGAGVEGEGPWLFQR